MMIQNKIVKYVDVNTGYTMHKPNNQVIEHCVTVPLTGMYDIYVLCTQTDGELYFLCIRLPLEDYAIVVSWFDANFDSFEH